MTAIEVETIPFEEMSEKMRRVFGTAIRFTLPQRGNMTSMKIKEHIQPVDSLAKMSSQYTSTADMAYRRSMAALIYLSVFAEGNAVERQGMIDALVLQLGADDRKFGRLRTGLQVM